MCGQNEHAYHRRGGCGDGCSGHAHSKRVDEYIVQHNISQTSCDHTCHGQSGRAVVTHKTGEQIVPKEQGREKEQNPQIIRGIADGFPICSKDMSDLSREQRSGRGEDYSRRHGQVQCMCKNGLMDLVLWLGG